MFTKIIDMVGASRQPTEQHDTAKSFRLVA